MTTPDRAASTRDVQEAGFPRWRRSVAVIALGAFMPSLSMSFWSPFLPLYMKELGAKNDAAALTWVGIAFTGSGIARLVSGPLWGVLADRYGRKAMFLRALFAATLTTLIAAVATAPWHVAVAWTSQGLLSGFIPAAVALTSVSVPPTRLTAALSSVQGAQYTGTTVGPVAGAVLAAVFGLRGAVLAGALLPAGAGVIVALAVPRDRVAPRVAVGADRSGAAPAARTARAAPVERESRLTTFTGGLSVQLGLGLLVFFTVHMAGGLLRTAAPVALEQLSGAGAATGLIGWTFAAGGLASAAGSLGLARLLRAPGRLRATLVGVTLLGAAAHALLGVAGSPVAFGLVYALTGLTQGAMVPAANTVIAAAVPHERRGAAFGLASSVQALAIVAGPLSAAYFATVSLAAGFILLGGMVALVALIVLLGLREPHLEQAEAKHRPATEAAG